jgi:hypothetical protein
MQGTRRRVGDREYDSRIVSIKYGQITVPPPGDTVHNFIGAFIIGGVAVPKSVPLSGGA